MSFRLIRRSPTPSETRASTSSRTIAAGSASVRIVGENHGGCRAW